MTATSKTPPQVSSPPLSDLEQRLKLVSSEFDEGNIKVRIRLAASDHKFASFSTPSYQKLLSKHHQRAKFATPNPNNLDSFFITDFDLYRTIISFPNESAAGPDKIVPRIFKNLVKKWKDSAAHKFLKLLTKLIKLIGDGKRPKPQTVLFLGANLITLRKMLG